MAVDDRDKRLEEEEDQSQATSTGDVGAQVGEGVPDVLDPGCVAGGGVGHEEGGVTEREPAVVEGLEAERESGSLGRAEREDSRTGESWVSSRFERELRDSLRVLAE